MTEPLNPDAMPAPVVPESGAEVYSYDEIPYESHPFQGSHPASLAAVGMLAGLAPAPVENCRVLELGCAAGGNLLPMAAFLPSSQFIGIDLSTRQIADGQVLAHDARLENAELKAMSILDVNDDFGQFDYIICHGVYSWVPPEVQDKILDICKRNLTPNGIAYVSYNVYPGWHVRRMIREMMLYHSQGFPDAQRRVQQAKALLELLITASGGGQDPITTLYKSELQVLKDAGDYYLAHEHLETVNEPVYFHEFIKRTAAKGLNYIGEAHPNVAIARLPQEVKQKLAPLGKDVIRLEQYLDFMVNRRFRSSLLCHNTARLRAAPDAMSITGLAVSSGLVPESPAPDLKSNAAMKFNGRGGAQVTSSEPIVKAALTVLHESGPARIPFGQMLEMARRRLEMATGPDDAQQESRLAGALLSCYIGGTLELHAWAPPVVLRVTDRPAAHLLTRLQGERNLLIANLLHRPFKMMPLERAVLARLDGTRDVEALTVLLTEAVRLGQLGIKDKSGGSPPADAIPGILKSSIPQSLSRLAASALLVG